MGLDFDLRLRVEFRHFPLGSRLATVLRYRAPVILTCFWDKFGRMSQCTCSLYRYTYRLTTLYNTMYMTRRSRSVD